MYSVKELYEPASLKEALEILKNDPGATPLAGGTDVLVKMRKNRPADVRLLSLKGLEELKGITVRMDGAVVIGPLTTFTEIAGNPVIEKCLPALKTAAQKMGGPQIRNVATIGGNLCNGAVSADSAPALFACDAELLLVTAFGQRQIPIGEFYLGPGRVDLKEGELLKAIIVPRRGMKTGSSYIKFATRKAMDLAILGVAASCVIDEEGHIVRAGIALGVAAPTPIRCPKAEACLFGKKPTEDVLRKAGDLAVEEASPRDSWRASKRYRQALIRELTGRAVAEAYERAGGRAV